MFTTNVSTTTPQIVYLQHRTPASYLHEIEQGYEIAPKSFIYSPNGHTLEAVFAGEEEKIYSFLRRELGYDFDELDENIEYTRVEEVPVWTTISFNDYLVSQGWQYLSTKIPGYAYPYQFDLKIWKEFDGKKAVFTIPMINQQPSIIVAVENNGEIEQETLFPPVNGNALFDKSLRTMASLIGEKNFFEKTD